MAFWTLSYFINPSYPAIANKRIKGKEKKSNSKIQMNDQPPRNVPFIQKAVEMGLGTNDPEKIELLEVDFGASEEESIEEEEAEGEIGRAVNPAGSYKTRWGNIKRL
jgi:hypothetical protein